MTYNSIRGRWGLTLYSKEIKKEFATEEQWNKYIGTNILKAIQFLVDKSENLQCMVCPFSRNYNSKGSLTHHLRYDHYNSTVDYIREKIVLTKRSLSKMRVCCDEKSVFQVVYDGGSMGNDTILVCSKHIIQFPFNKRIISSEVIEVE